jgi:2-polyprenyl-3-methyl-5-hydroxy-6-metoxy-1,4-benzoquinol methylase
MAATAPGTSPCLLCGAPQVARHDFGRHRVMYCAVCALGQLAPLPTATELAALYDSPAYFEGDDAVGYAGYTADAPQLRRTFGAKLAWLARSGPLDALAEIGCGPGYLLQVAREAGVRELVGVDHNPWAVDQVRAAGIEAHRGSVEALPAGRRYDAVAMLDLLEHVPAPVPFLREVAARLKPGGRLLIMTPNIRSALARLSGRRWVSFKIPEHVVYYSPKSIRLVLARAGFEVTAVRSATQYVTVEFALDRLSHLSPYGTRALRAVLRPLGLERSVVPVTNGSIDVIARLQAS